MLRLLFGLAFYQPQIVSVRYMRVHLKVRMRGKIWTLFLGQMKCTYVCACLMIYVVDIGSNHHLLDNPLCLILPGVKGIQA
ncbi:hypothetical protein BDV29DRAFT_178141 [Aspergillus leporis]|jgi:hypothetical protein|uniref:Uncharacterized protein n=1 Tax=Aspergillus leporis TaxID=41062 RepID=A0A5N5WYD0_9EURO|nr:hypothetical protein BDV29DRAFT_178141 [Aspergillus leporis]